MHTPNFLTYATNKNISFRFFLPTLPSFVTYPSGQEPTGYVALSLINLHFLSKTSRKELLQFFCGSRTDSSPSKASAAAVDGVYPVKRDPTRGSVATGGDVAGMQLSCRDGWESFQGKCYKVCLVLCFSPKFLNLIDLCSFYCSHINYVIFCFRLLVSVCAFFFLQSHKMQGIETF